MKDSQLVTSKLRQIKNTLSSYLTKILPNYQITPITMYTLEFLRKNPDAMAVDLADEFGLTRGAVTQILDKLEQQHLVLRKPHPTSRRSIQIELTEKGTTLVDAILDDYHHEIEKLFTNYSEEELAILKQLLDKLPV
ncbi:MarR family transcriptional regulator [Paenibacillus selenitireducens]|uniref:MarR family transcriptional regulator n=1 Tax=Paenibacillus selenitireducens TaxID=1324314 RepID=A0A1T2X8J2_9BACL|nr:MarR family transcriptional regulator [Paenibacillus selenitireducens]OPA76208.1 MarR family transcriptional regulator [Paenibacillus selenitireducens]